MARQNKLKKTGGLKTNGGLMNKIFKVYMLLMFISCMVLLIVFGIRFSSVYNSQAKSHMNDVTAAAETGIEERISNVRITISDKGVGIPDVAKAMEPMYTTGNPDERAGLGFAVMQSFMDRVHVSSAPGRGTRVTMSRHLDSR